MNVEKKFLIGSSIIIAVLIVLGSFNNIVGYQTVQASNQKIITTEDNPKELLFQTIVDMANNKEVQKVILGSELTGKRFFGPDIKFSTFTPPVLTEKFLKRAYTMGVILSKTISKSKIHSMLEKNPVNNQAVQKEINAVIEKDATLKGELTQLSSSPCGCENDNTIGWSFPVLCTLLLPIVYFILILYYFSGFLHYTPTFIQDLFDATGTIGSTLNCFWM